MWQHWYYYLSRFRQETGGNECAKNIRALFANTSHLLVEHDWLNHEDFLKLIGQMSLNLAVSYTESFCIVAADSISQGIPIITSDSVPWNSPAFFADPNSSKSILDSMLHVHSWKNRLLQLICETPYQRLATHNRECVDTWQKVCTALCYSIGE